MWGGVEFRAVLFRSGASVLLGSQFNPFRKTISNALLQSFVVQPGVGVVDQATGAVVTGDEIRRDDLIKAYLLESLFEAPGTVAVLSGAKAAGEARQEVPEPPDTRRPEEVVESERWQALRNQGIEDPR